MNVRKASDMTGSRIAVNKSLAILKLKRQANLIARSDLSGSSPSVRLADIGDRMIPRY